MSKYILKLFIAGVFTSNVLFPSAVWGQTVNAAQKQNTATKKSVNTKQQAVPTLQPNRPTVAQFKEKMKETGIFKFKKVSDIWDLVAKNKNQTERNHIKYFKRLFGETKLGSQQVQEFDYKGHKALRVIFSSKQDNLVFEYLNHGNEVARINGVVYTPADLSSKEAFTKKFLTPKMRAQMQSKLRKVIFAQKTNPTYEKIRSLSLVKQAQFSLKYRQLLEAASKVYTTHKIKISMEDFNIENNHLKFEDFASSLILGEEAHAEKSFHGVEGDQRSASCIVAGYALEWIDKACPWHGNDKNKFYKEHPESQYCNRSNDNKGNFIACPSIVYGFTEDSHPHCVDTRLPDFQRATHPNGPCDQASRIDTVENKIVFLKNILRANKIQFNDNDVFNSNGEVKVSSQSLKDEIQNKVLNPLNNYIESAIKICDVEADGKYNNVDLDIASIDELKEDRKRGYKFKYKKEYNPVPKSTDHALQNDACNGILNRSLDVQVALSEVIQPPVVTATPINKCPGWGPEGTFEFKDGRCDCKTQDGYKIKTETENSITCGKDDNYPPLVDKPEPKQSDPSFDDATKCAFYQSESDKGDCELSNLALGGLTFFGVTVAACLLDVGVNYSHGSFCGENKKKLLPGVEAYIPPCSTTNTAGCGPENPSTPTTTTIPPVVAPRNNESTSIQTSPDGNALSIPDSIR